LRKRDHLARGAALPVLPRFLILPVAVRSMGSSQGWRRRHGGGGGTGVSARTL